MREEGLEDLECELQPVHTHNAFGPAWSRPMHGQLNQLRRVNKKCILSAAQRNLFSRAKPQTPTTALGHRQSCQRLASKLRLASSKYATSVQSVPQSHALRSTPHMRQKCQQLSVCLSVLLTVSAAGCCLAGLLAGLGVKPNPCSRAVRVSVECCQHSVVAAHPSIPSLSPAQVRSARSGLRTWFDFRAGIHHKGRYLQGRMAQHEIRYPGYSKADCLPASFSSVADCASVFHKAKRRGSNPTLTLSLLPHSQGSAVTLPRTQARTVSLSLCATLPLDSAQRTSNSSNPQPITLPIEPPPHPEVGTSSGPHTRSLLQCLQLVGFRSANEQSSKYT